MTQEAATNCSLHLKYESSKWLHGVSGNLKQVHYGYTTMLRRVTSAQPEDPTINYLPKQERVGICHGLGMVIGKVMENMHDVKLGKDN